MYWYVMNYVSIFSVHDIFGMISIDCVCVYTFMYRIWLKMIFWHDSDNNWFVDYDSIDLVLHTT